MWEFFCKTLDLKLRSVQKYFEVNSGHLVIGSALDQRGKKKPANLTPEWKLNLIKEHIESYPTMESHYCRATSNRKYLDAKLTLRKMYEQFCIFFASSHQSKLSPPQKNDDTDSCNRVPKENIYRKVFCNEYNLSFFVPRKDQCPICLQNRNGSHANDGEQILKFENHIKQKDRAQLEKK